MFFPSIPNGRRWGICHAAPRKSTGHAEISQIPLSTYQADVLHLDLGLVLKTFYEMVGLFLTILKIVGRIISQGLQAHNTIQFDDRDQMPRLSRFLFGSWLVPNWLEPYPRRTEISILGLDTGPLGSQS